MKTYKYTINGNKYDVAINEAGETTAIVTVNGEEFKVEWENPVEVKPVVEFLNDALVRLINGYHTGVMADPVYYGNVNQNQ